MIEDFRLDKDIIKVCDDVEIIKGKDQWIMINTSKKTWVKMSEEVGNLLVNANNEVFEKTVKDPYDKNEALEFITDLVRLGLIEKRHKGYERIYLCLTERCNLKCKICYRNLTHEKDVSTDKVVELISKASLLNPKEIVFTGGEATLREDLCEILEKAKEIFSNIVLLTNGTCITPTLAECLAAEKIKVQVSIDSLDNFTNDFIRGEDSHRNAMSGIDLLISKGVKDIEVSMTLVDYNGSELYEVQKYWQEKKVGFHSSVFMNMHPSTCNICSKNRDKFAHNLFCYIEKKSDDIPQQIVKLSDLIELIPGEGCMAGEKVLAISQAGKVFPCHLLMYEEMGVDIDLVVAGETDKLKMPHIKDLKSCSSCAVKYFCRGGCRAAAYAEYGDLSAKDPQCEAYEAFFSAFLWSWDDHRNLKDNLNQVRKMLH